MCVYVCMCVCMRVCMNVRICVFVGVHGFIFYKRIVIFIAILFYTK